VPTVWEMIGSPNSLKYIKLKVRLRENCMNINCWVDELGIS